MDVRGETLGNPIELSMPKSVREYMSYIVQRKVDDCFRHIEVLEKRDSPSFSGGLSGIYVLSMYCLSCSISQALTGMLCFYFSIFTPKPVVHTSTLLEMRQDINEEKTWQQG